MLLPSPRFCLEVYAQDVSWCAFRWAKQQICGTKQTATATALLMSFTNLPMPRCSGCWLLGLLGGFEVWILFETCWLAVGINRINVGCCWDCIGMFLEQIGKWFSKRWKARSQISTAFAPGFWVAIGHTSFHRQVEIPKPSSRPFRQVGWRCHQACYRKKPRRNWPRWRRTVTPTMSKAPPAPFRSDLEKRWVFGVGLVCWLFDISYELEDGFKCDGWWGFASSRFNNGESFEMRDMTWFGSKAGSSAGKMLGVWSNPLKLLDVYMKYMAVLPVPCWPRVVSRSAIQCTWTIHVYWSWASAFNSNRGQDVWFHSEGQAALQIPHDCHTWRMVFQNLGLEEWPFRHQTWLRHWQVFVGLSVGPKPWFTGALLTKLKCLWDGQFQQKWRDRQKIGKTRAKTSLWKHHVRFGKHLVLSLIGWHWSLIRDPFGSLRSPQSRWCPSFCEYPPGKWLLWYRVECSFICDIDINYKNHV